MSESTFTTAGGSNGTVLQLHTHRSGIPSESAFEHETGMTPGSFEALLREFKAEVRVELTGSRNETREDLRRLETAINEMTGDARATRAEHDEMGRKLEEHEMQLHGADGKSGLIIEVDRLKQNVRLAQWGFNLALTMGGALAVILLEYIVKHLS